MASETPLPETKARLGQIVFWYPHGVRTGAPHVAIVTGVAVKSLNLNILSPMSYNFLIRDGVRHMSDPDAKKPELLECGAWEHTPDTLRAVELERMVAAMRVEEKKR